MSKKRCQLSDNSFVERLKWIKELETKPLSKHLRKKSKIMNEKRYPPIQRDEIIDYYCDWLELLLFEYNIMEARCDAKHSDCCVLLDTLNEKFGVDEMKLIIEKLGLIEI